MPFPPQAPQPFTKDAIDRLGPGQMGCYGLFRPGVWVYIGKGDLRARLMAHLTGENACIGKQNPTHFVTMIIANADEAEKQLIRETQPTCNT